MYKSKNNLFKEVDQLEYIFYPKTLTRLLYPIGYLVHVIVNTIVHVYINKNKIKVKNAHHFETNT